MTARSLLGLLPNFGPDIACGTGNPDLFHAEDKRSIVRAQNICRTCPHQNRCATWARDNGIEHGIWGGINYSQTKRRDAA